MLLVSRRADIRDDFSDHIGDSPLMREPLAITERTGLPTTNNDQRSTTMHGAR
jgi:hypothetical protein